MFVTTCYQVTMLARPSNELLLCRRFFRTERSIALMTVATLIASSIDKFMFFAALKCMPVLSRLTMCIFRVLLFS